MSMGPRLLAIPRLGRRYATRRGYYSRLRFVAARAAAVWSPSRASAADVARHFGFEAAIVPYCYNSDLFTAARASRPSPPTRVPLSLLSISRLVPDKNQAAVIRAAARLGARVELIGRGPTQPALEALAGRLGVPCRVRSGLSGEEIVAAYQQASIVVCPSRFEGLGLTGIEGAICGAPVVASDIAPHREFLGPAAQFFRLDDDDSLVEAIERSRVAAAPPTDHFASLTIRATAQRVFDRLQALL